jgi:hypothetical protein
MKNFAHNAGYVLVCIIPKRCVCVYIYIYIYNIYIYIYIYNRVNLLVGQKHSPSKIEKNEGKTKKLD